MAGGSPPPRLGEGGADPLVGYLDLAPDRSYAGHHRVPRGVPAAVLQDVGACLGGREQNVIDGFLVHPQPAQGVAEYAAHHRDAQPPRTGT